VFLEPNETRSFICCETLQKQIKQKEDILPWVLSGISRQQAEKEYVNLFL
jgi:hypothetical protein